GMDTVSGFEDAIEVVVRLGGYDTAAPVGMGHIVWLAIEVAVDLASQEQAAGRVAPAFIEHAVVVVVDTIDRYRRSEERVGARHADQSAKQDSDETIRSLSGQGRRR